MMMEESRVNVRRLLCSFHVYLCIAPLLLLHSGTADALRDAPVVSAASPPPPEVKLNALMKMILDMVRPLDDSPNTHPYVGSPFTLPPYDSLAPMPLPLNSPPLCLYPTPPSLSPSTPIPTPSTGGAGFSPTPPSPSIYVPSPPSSIPNPPSTGSGGGGFSPNPPEYSNPPSGGGSGFSPSPPEYSSPPSGGGGGGGGGFSPTPPEYSNPPSGGGGGFNPSPPLGGGGGGFSPTPPEYSNPPSGGGGGFNPSPPSGGGGGFNPSPPEYSSPPSGGGGFNPSPRAPAFLPPIVYPSPAVPPPPYTGPKQALWCVVKPSVPEPIIMEALNYACASGAECNEILDGGACFQPNTVAAHASYAFNSYWQRTKLAGGTCGFGGIAIIVSVDPSYNSCHFMYV